MWKCITRSLCLYVESSWKMFIISFTRRLRTHAGKCHYIVSQNTSETKYLFEVKKNPQHLSNKPSEVHPTTYESMYVAIHYGGFDMKTGRKINEVGPHFLQYQNNAFFWKPWKLYVYSLQPKPADPYINTWLNMDYELQQGTKFDYLLFESSRALQASDLKLLKNQCEQERIQTFTILMLSLENPRLQDTCSLERDQCF